MNLWDAHLHTNYSGDSQASCESMIVAATSMQLNGITITDHLDWDYKESPHLFDLDIDSYFNAMKSYQSAYETDLFHILIGVELGLQEHLATRHHELLITHPFDYCIGSIHVVHGMDPYYPEYFQGRPLQESYEEYFQAILDNLYSFHEIDSLGHLDYIIRYGNLTINEQQNFPLYQEYSALIDEILRYLIKKGIALEINTGSYRCGLIEPNPAIHIIKRFHELGGSLITIGSDAHSPEHVGLQFQQLPTLLKKCGFQEYYVFQNRTPVPFML